MNWSHRQVRHLLRLLIDPAQLEQQPLAAALRDAMHASSARDAMISLIRQATPGSRPADELMRAVIFRQDVDGIKSHRAAALLGLSTRSYFRYREKAIEAIAQALEREIQSDREDTNQQIQFAKLAAQFDATTAYDIYARAVEEPRGQIAYEMVCLAIRANKPITRKMIERCGGPWRMMALTALGQRHIIGGRPRLAERWQKKLQSVSLEHVTPMGARAAAELASFEYAEAIRRCDMAAARAASERMKLVAQSNASLVGLALVVESQQACDDGDLDRAADVMQQLATHNAITRDPRIVARTAVVQSVLAFMNGRWEQALDDARFAAVALEEVEPGFALCANQLAGRVALQVRRTWPFPTEQCARYPASWITGQVLAVESRQRLGEDPMAARDAAQRAIQITTAQGARGALCFAQASMAFALDRLGETTEAQRLRVEAWESAVQLGRQFYLHDMFAVPDMRIGDCGSFDISTAFVDAVLRRIASLCDGGSGPMRAGEAALIRHALAKCGRLSRRVGPSEGLGVTPLAATWRDVGPSAPDGFQRIRVLGPSLAHDLSFCLHFGDREAFATRFVETLDSAVTHIAESRQAG